MVCRQLLPNFILIFIRRQSQWYQNTRLARKDLDQQHKEWCNVKTIVNSKEVQKTGVIGGTWHVYLLHKKTQKEEDNNSSNNINNNNVTMHADCENSSLSQ